MRKMNSKNYNIKRKKRVRKKPLRIAVFAVLDVYKRQTLSVMKLRQREQQEMVFQRLVLMT